MFFIILTFFAALFIEGLGSLVSVIGISALFGANPIIIALAIALDVGKVVTVSLLYTYWKALSKLMKTYALLAAAVTMIITSAGAAGYLPPEFQKSIMATKEGDLKVAVLKEQQAKYEQRKKQIDDQVAALPTKTTVNQRLRLMRGFQAEQKALDAKISEIDKSLPALQVAQIGTEAKAGPIVSISKAFKNPMEEAVSWVIGMIIFVFDPLAIFLIIAGNFLWARRKAELASKQPQVVAEQPVEPPKVEVFDEPQPEGFQPFKPKVGTRSEHLIKEPAPEPPAPTSEFPLNPKKDDVFFHTGHRQLYIFNGLDWVGANTLAVTDTPPEPEPLEDFWFETQKPTEPMEPVETEYETYETPPVVPEEEVVPEPEKVEEPEPVQEPVPRPNYEATGLLGTVNVEAPDVVVIPDDTDMIPMKVEPVPLHREEITRSSLGIVDPDPNTIVDAHRQGGFRPAASRK